MIINDFVIEAASDDMKEVELGKILKKKRSRKVLRIMDEY